MKFSDTPDDVSDKEMSKFFGRHSKKLSIEALKERYDYYLDIEYYLTCKVLHAHIQVLE